MEPSAPPEVGRPPARFAYLVLAHHRPAQVESLVDRLLALSPAAQVVVHYDASSADAPWNGRPPQRVHMVERTAVEWGDWSVVDATLRMLRYAVDDLDCDWFVLLSGDDRPARDLGVWERELSSTGYDGIVPARPVTKRPRLGRRPTADDIAYVRYRYRWRPLPAASRPLVRQILELVRRVSRFTAPWFKIEFAGRRDRWLLGTPRRDGPGPNWTIYSGPQWLALGERAARAVLEVDPSVVRWFTETWIPDQGFFQTVVYNDANLRLCGDVLTYVAPTHRSRRREWMVLRGDDLEQIVRSDAPFARKFDPSIDAEIIGRLDEVVDRSVRRAAPALEGRADDC